MLQAPNVRIAIIDDDQEDYEIIADYIKEIEGTQFTIDWCNNYESAIQKIKNREYDIYFVDYRLGNHTGLDLLQASYTPDFDDPFVLLTGKGNKNIDVKAMESGATDYLIKSELNAEKLERCIRYSLDRATNVKELKAKEKRYRNLFENSKDAVWIADEDLSFIEMNEASVKLFGMSAEELKQRSLFDFIKDEQKRNELGEAFTRGKNVSDVEIDLQNASRETKSCILSLSVIENVEGEELVYGILHDISNIRKAEMSNLQAQKLAANERLMRTLAHEIRNPLNNISLSIDQLTSGMDDVDSTSHLLSIMQRNCLRINHIITELLDLTKPLELSFQQHTLQEILDESIDMTLDRINLQKVLVQKEFPSSGLPISANKSKLIIAFTNILINAVESMEAGKGQLVVGLKTEPDGYVVTIKDNGKGIPREYLHKLFEPFFTMKKAGTGLGLAASYSIFQSHKASIRVESQVNHGTEFIIGFAKN